MMKAIKNFMNKPITWGASFKWAGIVLGLYATVVGGILAYEKWRGLKKVNKVESNLEEDEI